MIQLTNRLLVLADQIQQNETMADIGTDHGFLPLYLWEQNISPKVIMTDISAPSLDKARNNHSALGLDFRLGDGLQILKSGEVDVVVLAGMGGILMTEILGFDLNKTKSFRKLVLQPRTGQGNLRYRLIKNGFGISRESLVREGNYICEILTVTPFANDETISREKKAEEADIFYEVPPWILTAGDLAEAFIENKLETEKSILWGLAKSKENQQDKTQKTEKRIKYLEELLGAFSPE